MRFGTWDKILAEPEVSQEQLISRAMRHYARGAAQPAMSDAPNARAELDHLDQMMESVTDNWLIGMHRVLGASNHAPNPGGPNPYCGKQA